MSDAHAKILSKAPGKNKNKKEDATISNLLTGKASKPSFRDMKNTPAGTHKPSGPTDEQQQAQQIAQEKYKAELVWKINQYLQNPKLGPLLAEAGMRIDAIFPNDAPFEVAQATYEKITTILGKRGVTQAIRRNIPRLNIAVEGALCKWGINVKGFSDSFDQNIENFDLELEELSIELSSKYGGAGLMVRLGAKYLDLLWAQKQANDHYEEQQIFSNTQNEDFQQSLHEKFFNTSVFSGEEIPFYGGAEYQQQDPDLQKRRVHFEKPIEVESEVEDLTQE